MATHLAEEEDDWTRRDEDVLKHDAQILHQRWIWKRQNTPRQ